MPLNMEEFMPEQADKAPERETTAFVSVTYKVNPNGDIAALIGQLADFAEIQSINFNKNDYYPF